MFTITSLNTCIRGLKQLVIGQSVWQMDGLQGFPEAPAEERIMVDVHVVHIVRVIDFGNLLR